MQEHQASVILAQHWLNYVHTRTFPLFPIPGPSAFLASLCASGLSTDSFTFVGFLPKNNGRRRQGLMTSANDSTMQIFFAPPHKFLQFVEEALSIFTQDSSGEGPSSKQRKPFLVSSPREKLHF